MLLQYNLMSTFTNGKAQEGRILLEVGGLEPYKSYAFCVKAGSIREVLFKATCNNLPGHSDAVI